MTLPDSNGADGPMERYSKCIRSYNLYVRRHNTAAGELTAAEADYNDAYDALEWLEGAAIRWFYTAKYRLEAADREYEDVLMWLGQAEDELNRAAAAVGLEGAP